MSAFTSSMAFSWSGVSTNGKPSSISRCHGRVGAEREARRVAPASGRARPAPGRSPARPSGPGLGLLEVRAAEAVERGRLAADVVADGVDLVGRDVELVAALVLEQQVVALDPADGPLDHAAVAADAVVVVDDVVAGLEVLEDARRLPPAGPRGAVGPAAAGEVGLGQHRQLDLGEDGAECGAAPRRSARPARVSRSSTGRLARRGRVRESSPCSPRIRERLAAEPSPSAATTTR